MTPEQKNQVEILLNEVRTTPWKSNECAGAGRAYLIAALGISLNETTLYHYPAFYNIHHSLELLIKGIFNVSADEHKLKRLIDDYPRQIPYKINNFFSSSEINDINQSDLLNSDRGQLRYYKDPHKQFDWDLFLRLARISKRLIKQDK